MKSLIKLLLIILFIPARLDAQEHEIDRLITGELKMTFPSIYFKHNSTEYADMPYRVDSCFKHIAFNYDKDLNSLVIWRDSMETEELTNRRIKKLNSELRKYIKGTVVEIYSMKQKQKISRRTINMTSNEAKIDYLLTLNSVCDMSKTRMAHKTIKRKKERKSIPHLVWTGWRTGFHWSSTGGVSQKKRSGE